MTLRNQDCLEFLSNIQDNTVDLIVTDPPYFQIVKNEWDNQWSSEDEYLEWCTQWTMECARVLKPERCLYVWGTTKTDTFLRYKLEVLNRIETLHYKNWIIWAYDWGGRTKKTFPRKHEDLIMYSKGKDFLFNADEVKVERAVKSNMNIQRKINLLTKKLQNKEFNEKDIHSWKKYKMDSLSGNFEEALDSLKKKDIKFSKGKIPTDVWTKNNHTTSKEYCGWHPTQKPIQLLERIIRANTNEGDTVVDIFNGSGSTMIACDNTNRNFSGCELDTDYYEKSLLRREKMKKYKDE
jgi:DNA modification methylase